MVTFNSNGIDSLNSGLIGRSTAQNINQQSVTGGNLYNTLYKNSSTTNLYDTLYNNSSKNSLYDTLYKNSSTNIQESLAGKGIQNNNSLDSLQKSQEKSGTSTNGLFSKDGSYLYGGLFLNNLSNSNLLFGNYSSLASSLQGLQNIGNNEAIQSYTLLKNIPLFQKGIIIDGLF